MESLLHMFESDNSVVPSELVDAFWYHGYSGWVSAAVLLRKDGDYIVRASQESSEGRIVYAVSMKWNSTVQHFIAHQDESGFRFDTHYESNVYKLVWWHRRNKVPLTVSSQAVLLRGRRKPTFLLEHGAIKSVQKLGDGAYGELHEAICDFGTACKGEERIAVKILRSDFTKEDHEIFAREGHLLRVCRHRHIVNILGIAVLENPLMILTEFCQGGSLLSYLRENGDTMYRMSRVRLIIEAADALSYIHSKGVIHRDVATRNCFFWLTSTKKLLKIGNFEMAHEQQLLHDNPLHRRNVKWMAPESLLEGTFSAKTDVWSYGVLVWEIYSGGLEPYTGMDNSQAREAIVGDHRLELLEEWNCPRSVEEIVVSQCWNMDAEERPSMSTIHEHLKNIHLGRL